MISAKNVTPSISAAAMIMAVWMLPAVSGWRAMLSTAALARPPMPSAAPMMTRPTPIARRVGERELRLAGVGQLRGLRQVLRRVAGGPLGERRPLNEHQQADGQHGGLDEFHRTLDSLVGHTRGKEPLGRRAARRRGRGTPRPDRESTSAAGRADEPQPRSAAGGPSVRVDRRADEQRRQEGEDVRLQERHEQLQQAQQRSRPRRSPAPR